ncbi:MAG TPA: threonine/serine dehydratase [Vicinamibacterales bacterium]|nr:threonine/serine dehydratase [Vicinamibacterales bacterium]
MDLADVFAARKRIGPYVRRTPLIESAWLSDLGGGRAWIKLESQQLSNSFKSRGAFNAVIARIERGARPARVVTASAGNHGRALAAACEAFHIPLVVFTPADAPQTKLAAITRHGAELRSEGGDYDDAEKRALAFARGTGAEFISPYNDADVIAGAGTVALELFEDAGEIDVIVAPIGGGGLISGVATAAKAIAPSCEVVGVEAEASCAFLTSVRAGRLVEIVPGETIADGLGGNPDPQTITFVLIQTLVDRIVTVSETDLTAAIAGLVEREHLIAEGAGAAATAAVVGTRVELHGRRAAVLLTGSNIDRSRLAAVLR